jgi:hypothetical protein
MKGHSQRGVLVLGAALAMSGLLGCGEEADNSEQFIGSWSYTSGTATSNCGGNSTTEQLQGTVSISKGVSSPLVSIEDGCTLAMDVNGTTASARIPQECSRTEQGLNLLVKYTALTFTVNGIVADQSGSATVQATGPGGVVNCNVTITARLMKVSR